MEGLASVLVLLAAAVVSIPLARRIGVSPMLGYLAAGVVIGQSGLGLVERTELIQALGEVGVLFLLFAIGLELSLARLRELRGDALRLGSAQVLLSAAAIGAVVFALLGSAPLAIVVGGSFAMSSTAIVLQLLRERGELGLRHGRAALAVLLLQDLLVVPLLAVIPLFAGEGRGFARELAITGAKVALAVVGIVLVGRRLLRPVYRAVAASRYPEVLLSLTLLVALGTAFATDGLGLSTSLGAFLAGVLVAETEFRHQVEADIEPFRALLLGLFFVNVGLSLDLGLVVERRELIAVLLVAVLVVKPGVLLPAARSSGFSLRQSLQIALLLAQAGEFGFVALGLAQGLGLLGAPEASVFFTVIALTMFASPLLAAAGRRLDAWLARRRPPDAPDSLAQAAAELDGHVVVAGFGRVGLTVAKVLDQHGFCSLGLEIDAERVRKMRGLGLRVFVGDATRIRVLASAGIERARAAVVTIDAPEGAVRVCTALRRERPELPIFARARNREHGKRLLDAGATAIVAEAAEGSLELSARVLESLELSSEEIGRTLDALRADDYARLEA